MFPEYLQWNSLVFPAVGEVLGRNLSDWQREFRESNNIPQHKPVIMVGHQPTFFHPGILAKFIAANRIAKQVGGVVVFLVADHHIGNATAVEYCVSGNHLQLETKQVSTLDATISLKDQPRVKASENVNPFTDALKNASGDNAAMQIANALVLLMEPFACVNHVVPASALIESSFGNAMLEEMQRDSEYCIEAYNTALTTVPSNGIPFLDQMELPLWEGRTNQKLSTGLDLRPRALTLTLLARLIGCDLFVHGTGGYAYDKSMEHWCSTWLGAKPCHSVMATASLRLPLKMQTWTDARRAYFSPPFDIPTKETFLNAISSAEYGSPQRQVHFQEMRRWLETIQLPLHKTDYIEDTKIAMKRNWAFPLYCEDQLHNLVKEINEL